jgi:hypothetical protein
VINTVNKEWRKNQMARQMKWRKEREGGEKNRREKEDKE